MTNGWLFWLTRALVTKSVYKRNCSEVLRKLTAILVKSSAESGQQENVYIMSSRVWRSAAIWLPEHSSDLIFFNVLIANFRSEIPSFVHCVLASDIVQLYRMLVSSESLTNLETKGKAPVMCLHNWWTVEMKSILHLWGISDPTLFSLRRGFCGLICNKYGVSCPFLTMKITPASQNGRECSLDLWERWWYACS